MKLTEDTHKFWVNNYLNALRLALKRGNISKSTYYRLRRGLKK